MCMAVTKRKDLILELQQDHPPWGGATVRTVTAFEQLAHLGTKAK